MFGSGEGICNQYWGEAFRYVPRTLDSGAANPEYDLAYTMWFFEKENPNLEVSRLRIAANLTNHGLNNVEECHLDYLHHDTVKSGQGLTECHPYEDAACCKPETVLNVDRLKYMYGVEYAWDVCGPIDQECERFLVQENCMYECDPSVGLYRQFSKDSTEDDASWRVKGMPIKGEYCDAFFQACADQPTCRGDSLECYASYQSTLPEADLPDEDAAELTDGAKVGIAVLAVLLAVTATALACVLRRNRRRGMSNADKFEAPPVGASGASAAGASSSDVTRV
mmetsp:Transcript_11323/g.28552  ORF Transcript_11323/g.28552 Transcript_11323/m.28552 type:complete len:281 (-) Transcript_11323:253-1095(-)